jgi:hypothetical protein
LIDPIALTADLQQQLRLLETDLRDAAEALRPEHEQALRAGRTSATWTTWRDERLTQAAAAWVLGTVFVRFAEDNGLIASPVLAGPTNETLATAAAAQARQPGNARDWLLHTFETLAGTPASRAIFDREHNPLYQVPISAVAADELVAFWRRTREDGCVIHDFTHPDLDTSFLSVLYQDLSESARRTYALQSTPDFVVSLLLDLTITPALAEFSPRDLRVIDPACGSGHFMLAAFDRLVDASVTAEPGLAPQDVIKSVMPALHGVDLCGFAVNITRFRLLVAAVRYCGRPTFDAIPVNWRLNIAVGDALLPDPPFSYSTEDLHKYPSVLQQASYHVVLCNPPYTTVRDKAANQQYRSRYNSCMGAYSLTIPFAERFFQLALPGDDDNRRAGYVGQFVANSFMKREFGRNLVEHFYARNTNLTHVIDTSGAYIPGHGTPTAIIVGRNHQPADDEPILAVIGRRGEPAVPTAPSHGLVWQSIQSQAIQAGHTTEWTQSIYLDRARLRSHPWQLTDTDVTELLQGMSSSHTLSDRVARIGYYANTGSDQIFTAPPLTFRRTRAENNQALIKVVTGSEVRDWIAEPQYEGFFPRTPELDPVDIEQYPRHLQRMWPFRTVLGKRPNYTTRSYFTDRRKWYDWHHIAIEHDVHPWSITFPWVATHNNFALLRDRVAPLHSAPIIRLRKEATEDDHLGLLGLLNSSAVCFWTKQHSHSKGRTVHISAPDGEADAGGDPWSNFYEFTATMLRELPLPSRPPVKLAAELDRLARELLTVTPASVLVHGRLDPEELTVARERWHSIRPKMIALQEELDWEVYASYGLIDKKLVAPPDLVPSVHFGERAFEILLARKIAAGEIQSTWFTRHGASPATDIPSHWPAEYQDVVRARMTAIERHPGLDIVERPEFKRRWSRRGWAELQIAAARDWLLRRCESADLWFDDRDGHPHPQPRTIEQLADALRTDPRVIAAAELYAPGTSLTAALNACVADEHVPYLSALRYRDSGLRKRAVWETVWQRQREEDKARARGDEAAATTIRDHTPVPPKYTSADFTKASYWRLRGKFDVPNERFIAYPNAQPTGDRNLLLGWAGWEPEHRAQVLTDLITAHLEDPQDPNQPSLLPLLAGVHEITPWLPPDDQRTQQLHSWMRTLNTTTEELLAWRPPKSKRGRPRKATPT